MARLLKRNPFRTTVDLVREYRGYCANICAEIVCNEHNSWRIKDILRSFETKMEDNSMHRELNISWYEDEKRLSFFFD